MMSVGEKEVAPPLVPLLDAVPGPDLSQIRNSGTVCICFSFCHVACPVLPSLVVPSLIYIYVTGPQSRILCALQGGVKEHEKGLFSAEIPGRPAQMCKPALAPSKVMSLTCLAFCGAGTPPSRAGPSAGH